MLHVHRSERADALVPALAQVLAEPLDDVLARDVVAVPTRGVERWLAQRLSHVLGAEAGEAGVCANVDFASPARLVEQALARASGTDPQTDPWRPAALLWAVLDVVDECAGEAWCGALGRHLGVADDSDDVRRGRRLAVAGHLAGLFTAYGAQRPTLVRDWAAGRDTDGAGGPVPADLAWQAELWRRLRGRLGVASPAERLDDAVAALAARPGLVDLPDRLAVFGPTRLPADQLAVLGALARHREVHLWLPHPSPTLWDAVAAAGAVASPRRRAHGRVARHPLLASMARDAVELQVRLAAAGPATGHHHPAPLPDGPPTLLRALQQRLRDDDADAAPAVLAPQDASVRVHACHGRARQVEVLREVVLGLLDADPTLEPRDVVVMCPDVEAFAPLVAASFGAVAEGADEEAVHPGQRLRVRLADRSLRQTNPQLSLLSTLLDLADGRVTASQVLDLAASEPVRRRFRFDDDDLDRLRTWSVEAGVHWGEDVTRRDRFGLGHIRQGTWDMALDRVLLGVAMADEEHRVVGPALPLDDVDSVEVDLAGRLAELVDRLTHVLRRLTGSRPLADWLDALEEALDLLADARPADAWQPVEARRVLADVRAGEHEHALVGGSALRLPDVRALLASRLRGRPTRAGFRTGALTVCSLEPMRAVPHRVVVLLGLSDGAFPRRTADDGDDVLLREPCLGERDRRSEDRQLFLDAVLAAQDTLVVLHSGADERTGARRPPAVPVAELLDALDRTAVGADGRAAREHVVVRHPLQPVDERNFVPGALAVPRPFSFDRFAHEAAGAARGTRTAAPVFLEGPLPAQPREDLAEVDLDDLVEMLEHPVKWFVRRRLDVQLPAEVDDVEDRLPLELGALVEWGLGDAMLEAALDGVAPEAARAAQWRRGVLPPRELGRAGLDAVQSRVRDLYVQARPFVAEPAQVVDVSAALRRGGLVVGSVPGVHGRTVVRSMYSRLGAKHRLRAWAQLLALTVSRPDEDWRAVTVGRRTGGAMTSVLRKPDPAKAETWLEDLLRVRERAKTLPLPLPPKTALAYARSRAGREEVVQALEAARREWEGRFGERLDPYHALVWGEGVDLAVMAGEAAADDAAWTRDGDTSGLGALAMRVWTPLLEHEGRIA